MTQNKDQKRTLLNPTLLGPFEQAKIRRAIE
jgi:hypothetical protein